MTPDQQLILPLPAEIVVNLAYTPTQGKFRNITSKLDFQRQLGNVLVLENELTFLDIKGSITPKGDYRERDTLVTLAVHSPENDTEYYHKQLKQLGLGTPSVFLKKHSMEISGMTAEERDAFINTALLPVHWVPGIQVEKGAPTDAYILQLYRDIWTQMFYSFRNSYQDLNESMDQRSKDAIVLNHLVNWLSALRNEMTVVDKANKRLDLGVPTKLPKAAQITDTLISDIKLLKARSTKKIFTEVENILRSWPYDVCWIQYRNNVEILADSISWKSRKKYDRRVKEAVEKSRRVSLSAYKKIFKPLVLFILMRCTVYSGKANAEIFRKLVEQQDYDNLRYDDDSLRIGALSTSDRELEQVKGLLMLLSKSEEKDLLEEFFLDLDVRSCIQQLNDAPLDETTTEHLGFLWKHVNRLDNKESKALRKHTQRALTAAVSSGIFDLTLDGTLLKLINDKVI